MTSSKIDIFKISKCFIDTGRLFLLGIFLVLLLTLPSETVYAEDVGQNKDLLDCLCRCLEPPGGQFGCWYDETDRGHSPSCANLENGPCICKAYGCFRGPLPTDGECYDNCHSKFAEMVKEDATVERMPLDKTNPPTLSSNAKLLRILQIYQQKIPKGLASSGCKNNLLSWFYPEYEEFSCGGYQGKVLRLLDELKFSDDPTEKTLLDDWDYGPIEAYWGGHQAVVIYPKGTNWVESGIVLDPWPSQSPEACTIDDWATRWSLTSYHGIDGSSAYGPVYPTVGGNYVNPKLKSLDPEEQDFLRKLELNPEQKKILNKMSTTEKAAWIRNKMAQQNKGARAMGNSPLNMYIVDEAGRISGFPNGEPKYEIPDATIRRAPLIDGTYWTELEYPQDRPYKLVMEGTSNGEARVFMGFGFENEMLLPSIYRYIIQVASGQSYEIETNYPDSSIKSGTSLITPLKIDTVDQAWLNSEPEIVSLPEISSSSFTDNSLVELNSGESITVDTDGRVSSPRESAQMPEGGSARTLLEDDFNDGSYTDFWTIDWSHTGNPTGNPAQQDFELQDVICEGSNCYLRGHTTQDPGFSKNAPVLYTRNPTNVGSWQFDSRLLSSEEDSANFILLSTGNKSFKDDYYMMLHSRDEISLQKRIDRKFTTLISGAGLGGQDNQWHIIKVTRDDNGLWSLFVDEALVGTAEDSTLTDLSYLMIGRYGDFDNIIVTGVESGIESYQE